MIKTLIINNDNDLKKFYKNLFWYRSFLYKRVFFEIKKDKYGIKPLIDALNIKKKRKRINFIYDSASLELDNYYKDKDMCGFKNNQCYMQRKNRDKKINGCCRMCINQQGKGCLTSNLTCKLFYCSEVKKRHKTLEIKDLKIVKCLTLRQQFIIKTNYFTSKEELLRDLYIGWISIILFHYLYRIIRNCFVRYKRRSI